MKSKSKKGKPKGKTFYSYDYFVEIEKYDDLDYVNVLSLQDDDGLQTVQDAKVIIDTGATESVAGVTCMARLLDRIKSNYKVCLTGRSSSSGTAWFSKPLHGWISSPRHWAMSASTCLTARRSSPLLYLAARSYGTGKHWWLMVESIWSIARRMANGGSIG